MSDREKLISMAWDAFRVCIGIKPRTFTRREVALFVCRRVRQS